MGLSRIGRTIGESATLKLNATAAALRQQGEPIIHLGGGEPKGKAPQDAITAAAAVLATGEVRYTAADGVVALKQAIVRYTEEFYGRLATPANVIASSGGKQALMVCLQAILDPGDEVIYPAPYWVSYPDMVKLAGGVGVAVPPQAGSFLPRLEDLARSVGDRTRAVILNSPNNPSGVVYPEALVSEIVRFCEDRGLYLILDDIYQRLLFDGRRPVRCWDLVRDRSEDSLLVIVNGVSKQYAMTGFRIGWAVASRTLVEAMAKIQSHQTSGPSAILQAAAIGALNGSQSGVESLCATLEANRNVMLECLRSIPRISLIPPGGAFYCFPDFGAHERSSAKLADFLLEKVRVVTVPGVEFGMDGYLRLSYCGSVEEIREGIARIRWALDPSAPREISLGGRRLVRDWA